MSDQETPTPGGADLEQMARRGLRIARIYGRKLTRKIEATFPATKGTNWKKVLFWGGVCAATGLVGGELLDGAGGLAEGTGESAMSGSGTTGVSVVENGVLCSDGSSVTFPS